MKTTTGGWLQRIGLGVMAALIFMAGFYGTAMAYPAGGVFGRAAYHGYFTNIQDNGGTSVLPIIDQGLAIPNYIDSVGEFVQLLKNANGSGNRQRVTGSAFIVYTMLGRDGAGYSRNVSGADWTELTARLNNRAANGKISWSGNVVDCTNSYWQGIGDQWDGGAATDDDAYYDNCKNESGIRFYNDNGSIAYELLRFCANPMGKVGGLPQRTDQPKPPVDTQNPGSSSNGCKPMLVRVNPGRDARGNPVPVKVWTRIRTLGTFSQPTTINITSDHTTGDVYTVYYHTNSYISNYTPVRDKAGVIIRWDPVYASARTWTTSIGPCYDYSLTPQVDLGGQTTIESGGSARVTNTVTNAGPTKTPKVDWRLTRLIYVPGTTLSGADMAARTNNTDPCGSFRAAGRTGCDVVWESAAMIFPKPAPSDTTRIFNYIAAADLPTGTQVCFTVGVSKPTEDPTPVWRHSMMRCLMVSKKPKFQVHGGDVRSGGTVETGLSTVTAGGATKTYGSWVEYGALSVGPNNGFASGSGLNKGGPAAPSAWNKLTFANIDDNGNASYGNYAMAPRFASLVGQFTSSNSSGVATANLSGLTSGTYTAGNLVITGGNIGQDGNGKGKSIIIRASGLVTITGDINYVGPSGGDFTQIDQIPQVVIIAGNINIRGSVNHLDAWLMTTGTTGAVNTCSDVAATSPLNSNICGAVLTVNGPVVTSHLYLRRTAGADDGNRSGDPAEVFNLRADALLWQHTLSSEAGKAQTVYTSELPPRF